MFNSLTKIITLAALVVMPTMLLAQGTAAAIFTSEQTSVNIDDIVLSVCGPQTIYPSGATTYAPTHLNSHLEVTIDGVVIYTDSMHSSNWITSTLIPLAGRVYEIKAVIYDDSFEGEFGPSVLASDSISVTAVECQTTPSPTPDPENAANSGGGGGGGDQGPGGDCCPGPDPNLQYQSVRTPQVKGVSTGTSLWDRLNPLNNMFRSVFGRTPTRAEWHYWADRLLTDKPEYDALIGAMQWQSLHAQTMGIQK